jgi:hypothetical protein
METAVGDPEIKNVSFLQLLITKKKKKNNKLNTSVEAG